MILIFLFAGELFHSLPLTAVITYNIFIPGVMYITEIS